MNIYIVSYPGTDLPEMNFFIGMKETERMGANS